MTGPSWCDADGHVCEPLDLWERNLPAVDARPRAAGAVDDEARHAAGPRRGPRRHPDGSRRPRQRRHAQNNENFGERAALRGREPGGLRRQRARSRCSTRRASTSPSSTAASGRPRRHPGPRARGRVPPGVERLDGATGLGRARPARGLRGDPGARSRGRRRARCTAAAAMGLRAGVIRPNPVLGEPLWSPRLRPDVRGARGARHPARAARRRAVRHGGDVSKRMVDLMASGTHHALILFFDQYLTLSNLVYGGCARAASRRSRSRCSSAAAGGSRTGWTAWTSSWRRTTGRPRRCRSRRRSTSGASASISFDPGRAHDGAMADLAGADNLIWASDFPHCDAKYPGVVDELREHTDDDAPRRPRQARRRQRGAALRDRGARRAARRCAAGVSRARPRRSRRARRRRHRAAGVHRRRRRRATAGSRRSAGSTDAARRARSTPTAASSRPGFVDIHTHYDAQLHWEPTASPSSWHGVTTVITGNCGFSLFPARPDDVDVAAPHAEPRRGHAPRDARRRRRRSPAAGYDDFAAGLDGRLGVNVGLQVGHSALRRYVMRRRRRDARRDRRTRSPRWPTSSRDALRDGAVGLHVVAARHARRPPRQPGAVEPGGPRRARRARRGARPSSPHGVDRVHLRHATSKATPTTTAELMLAMCAASRQADEHQPAATAADDAATSGAAGSSSPKKPQRRGRADLPAVGDPAAPGVLRAARHVPVRRDARVPRRAHRRRPSERSSVIRRVRDAMRAAVGRHRAAGPSCSRWDAIKVAARRRASRMGRPHGARARASSSGPATTSTRSSTCRWPRTCGPSSRSAAHRGSDRGATTEEIVAHPLTLPGSSDAGAHLSSYCGVDYTTRLLTEYVPDALPLEEAVRAAHRHPGRALRVRRSRRRSAPVRAPTSSSGTRRASPSARPGGSRTSLPAAAGSSSTRRAIERWSSTARSCAATESRSRHARARCSGPEPRSRGSPVGGAGVDRRAGGCLRRDVRPLRELREATDPPRFRREVPEERRDVGRPVGPRQPEHRRLDGCLGDVIAQRTERVHGTPRCSHTAATEPVSMSSASTPSATNRSRMSWG